MEKQITGTIISVNENVLKMINVSKIKEVIKGDTVRLLCEYGVFRAIVTSIDYEKEEFECEVFDEKWF
jgi:hypothetical protein